MAATKNKTGRGRKQDRARVSGGQDWLPPEEIEEAAQRRWRYADRSSLAFVSQQTKDNEMTAYPLSALQF